MSTTRYENLATVLNHVWDELEAAARDPGHAYRQLTFGTVHERVPDLRTVVLRGVSEDNRLLQFHTDRRSRKVDALRENEHIAWHGWDPEAREQIRLYGTGTVHLDDDVAMDLWESQSPETLAVYARPSAPGSALDEPEDGLRPAVRTEPITDDDVAEGRQYFAAIRTTIDRIEWLHLHSDGHYRARFEYQSASQEFEGSWVVP